MMLAGIGWTVMEASGIGSGGMSELLADPQARGNDAMVFEEMRFQKPGIVQ